MLIFWEQRLVFLATPKAGSTAIEAALEPLASVAITRPSELKHTDVASWHAHVRPWLGARRGSEFTTVALMREPVDWLRSWYRFKLRDDVEDPGRAMHGVSFNDFARRYSQPDGSGHLQIHSQAAFLCPPDQQVNRIFRYEDMPAFVEFLEDRLDCVIELPRLNVPPSVDVGLTPEAESDLRQAMSADLALYHALG